ncbi:MAG: hypothetical protein SFV32_13555 [Opitutaceae bacterium]|nr:hypothetical protein [Opitutaceae bacterium]
MSQLDSLRALLAARFPERTRTPAGVISSGAEALDEAMGGGLPLGRVSEWVASAPSSGTQLSLCHLIAHLRRQNERVALVDAADALAPEEFTECQCEHLVWVRGNGLETSLAAADLLLHDGNFRLVVLDVRDLPAKPLQAMAPTLWYRLQRTAEETGTALLACTPHALVPSAALRLVFPAARLTLADRLRPSAELLRALTPQCARARHASPAPLRLAQAG